MADLKEDTVEVKPRIIMKVDAPPEDNNSLTSQGGSRNNIEQNDSVKPQSKSKKAVIASPRLSSTNPFSLRPSVLHSSNMLSSSTSGVVLRPSQLGAKLENKSDHNKNPFGLSPSRLNPFVKSVPESETSISENTKPENDKNSHPTTSDSKNGSIIETPKFVPLVVTEATSVTTTSTVASTSVTSAQNFVFGQNLHERVISESENANEATSTEPEASTSCTNANGTSELLFSSAVKKSVTDANKEVKSLSESAREYEESRANKRKYEEVAVVTGEEDEKNVQQINCKLFAFDKATGNWQERGRGTLRLNDKEITADNSESYTQSRLVIRATGSLRVVLNTKVWADMTIDRASPKSLRLTAIDTSGLVNIYLVMANPEEINQLQRLLEIRLRNEVERQKQLKNSNSEPEAKKPAMDTSGQ